MSELSFDGQRDGEKVQFIFRRHIATARKGLRFLIIMIIIGVIPMFLWPDIPEMFCVFLGCVVVGFFGLLYAYLLWYFSIYIVTNERIRQVNQKGLFKKSTVDLALDRIQSISVSTPGVIAGIFGYGTLLIQTNVGDLIISQVPKPDKIHNKLQNLIMEAESE
ncbi:PH domain-containing protein [Candidatus Saccharibacteria bacterium]|nr:PH domain-containing protein [Candidatus Saccharibacteria bacterium]